MGLWFLQSFHSYATILHAVANVIFLKHTCIHLLPAAPLLCLKLLGLLIVLEWNPNSLALFLCGTSKTTQSSRPFSWYFLLVLLNF